MERRALVLALPLLAGGHRLARAADAEESGTPPQAPARKPQVVNRVRPDEPMPGQMKRKGMMKESVHEQAMKKDTLMRDAMKREAPPKK